MDQHTDQGCNAEKIEEIANYLKKLTSVAPQIGIICGSGLGCVGEIVKNPVAVDYKSIPNFPVSTVIGHAGRLIFGEIGKIPVVCMQGRFHFYEGYTLSKCTLPVRVMKLLGVHTLIVSNAAGSVNPSFKTGDVMFIKDHINFVGLAGLNPLRGPNEEKFGERFVPLNGAYNPSLIKAAKKIAEDLKMKGIREGVYACVGGPNYETVAEIKALRVLGADSVGMSTVHEVITARHCGLEVFAFSLITNEGVAEYDSPDKPNGEEVIMVANQKAQELKSFIEQLVPGIVKTVNSSNK